MELDALSYDASLQSFDSSSLWDLFDGDRDHLNIAAECLDRHDPDATGLRLRRADGRMEERAFGELAACANRFAHYLEDIGVERGDAVAVMIEPSLAFYGALFGAMKRGAVSVPLFTLFGPDAIDVRLADCDARVLVTGGERLASRANLTLRFDDTFLESLERYPSEYPAVTRADDLAVLQYTSGTSKQLPEAVRHPHRAIVPLMNAAIFALGLRQGDVYFCPSSPAWGHGLWHGTIAPWALGIAAGAFAGRFEPEQLGEALRHFEVTNFAAAGTVYRMLRRAGVVERLPSLTKATYTGEALEAETIDALAAVLRADVCGMYGTTETGVLIGNYPGFDGYTVRRGALGKPLPGLEVAVLRNDDEPAERDEVGEIAVRRRGQWLRARDLGRVDADGYFWYLGRADDVVISSGWTISPIEVERALLAHDAVSEVAVVGVPDDLRGQVLKAFVVTMSPTDGLVDEIQEFVKTRLSRHEYPREIEFVESLPKTENGKINRRALRAQVEA
jgi:acetyl-CoA synthetase